MARSLDKLLVQIPEGQSNLTTYSVTLASFYTKYMFCQLPVKQIERTSQLDTA